MRYLILLLGLFTASCYYSKGCWYSPQMVNCSGTEYPAIAHYQKKYSIGSTNVEQRWNDVVACGGKYGDGSLRSAVSKGNNEPVDTAMQQKFRACMGNKGYFRVAKCGWKNSPTDTGMCN